MKLSVSTIALQQAVGVVSRAVSHSANIPIVTGMLMTADGNGLMLTGYDLEMAIETRIPATVEEPGAIVVPGKQFEAITKKLPHPEVVITAQNTSAIIKANKSRFTLQTMAVEDYPALPEASGKSLTIPGDKFCAMVRRVAFATATDVTRPVMAGVLTTLADGKMAMAATDSFRMAVRRASMDTEESVSTILPARFLSEIERISGAFVRLILGNQHVQATVGETRFIARLYEGAYPEWERVMPDQAKVQAWITVERDTLLSAIERVSLMCEDQLAPMRFTLDEDTHDHLLVEATNPEIGNAKEELNIVGDFQGNDPTMQVSLRPSYLRDALRVMTGDVRIGYTGIGHPVLVLDQGDPDYSYVIMPMTTNSSPRQ
ncbi:MAG: DNA polymerase III subunit beta [Clostridia bacterium]|nr:DNA polymerase III subunit beta [Clostridia bacterium]